MPLEWAASKSLLPDQNRPVPLVLFKGPCAWQQEMLGALRTAGWEWRVTFESGSMDASLTAVQSGLGMAALPAETVRSSKLARVESAGLPPAPEIQIGIFRGAASHVARSVLEDIIASVFENSSDRATRMFCLSKLSTSLPETMDTHGDTERCPQSYGERNGSHGSEEVHRDHGVA